MDLSVSPDIAAYYCYAIVFALGAWTGFRQVSTRLGGIRGIWLVPRTWLLFLAYLAVPVGLFWLLDRTSAITDTSFFAAVLIGVGYERIIAGSNETIQAPGQASRFWTPFLTYADSVERSVREQIARNQARIDERVIGKIAEDPAKFEALEALARSRSPDVQALDNQLKALDAAAANQGDAELRERKARFLYGIMLSVPDYHYLMKSKHVISDGLYWFALKGAGGVLRAAAVFVLIAGLAVLGTYYFKPDFKVGLANYYVWRLGKPNTTTIDQFRSRQSLLELMHSEAIDSGKVTRQLVNLLRRPSLPMERVDLVLGTMLESAARPRSNERLPTLLVESLRAADGDARLHINEVLIYLAPRCDEHFVKDQWQVPKGEATVLLEELIGKWSVYWENCSRRRKPI
jgi:hypothetical protein